MAMTTFEKQAFKRGIADEAASTELQAILTSGTAASVQTLTKIALKNAVADDVAYATILAAFQTGSALDDRAKAACRRLMGSDPNDSLVTELGAVA